MSTNTSEATAESVRPVIVVCSDPRGVDVDNGEEIVCSVGSSILCVILTKVSLTRLGGYLRGIDSVHMEESTTNDELLKCCEIIHCSMITYESREVKGKYGTLYSLHSEFFRWSCCPQLYGRLIPHEFC